MNIYTPDKIFTVMCQWVKYMKFIYKYVCSFQALLTAPSLLNFKVSLLCLKEGAYGYSKLNSYVIFLKSHIKRV